jgi:hypothetical protein
LSHAKDLGYSLGSNFFFFFFFYLTTCHRTSPVVRGSTSNCSAYFPKKSFAPLSVKYGKLSPTQQVYSGKTRGMNNNWAQGHAIVSITTDSNNGKDQTFLVLSPNL